MYVVNEDGIAVNLPILLSKRELKRPRYESIGWSLHKDLNFCKVLGLLKAESCEQCLRVVLWYALPSPVAHATRYTPTGSRQMGSELG